MKNTGLLQQWLPRVFLLLAFIWVLSAVRPAPKTEFDIAGFGKLPALLGGRMQPMDSVARNTLLQILNKQSIRLPDKTRLGATEWMMNVTMKPEAADDLKIFRVDNQEVSDMLHLPPTNHYSFNDLSPSYDELRKQAERIQPIEAQVRSTYERQVMKVFNATTLYLRLKNSLRPPQTPDFTTDLAEFRRAITPGIEAGQAREAEQAFDQAALDRLLDHARRYDFMSRAALPLVVPPLPPAVSEHWTSIGANLIEAIHAEGGFHPVVERYAALATAYHAGKPAEFNRALKEHQEWLGQHYPRVVSKAKWEHFFNRFAPFLKAMFLYLAAFLLACTFWLLPTKTWLRRSAVSLIGLGLVIHTAGLIFRMVLEGRPPVTNLYSSAIFIGWAAVILGLVLERFYRDAIGAVTAASLGFVTLVIAHNLAVGGDTMEMLRAVLDTNFWLATHVVTVTLGYAATFVAGFLAIIYIVRGALTPSLQSITAKSLARMVYGIVCFATLFSFIGTVLGGIWADQSWGRFWGWDPKENGALLIVIWNAIFLHARWGKLLPERLLMALPVFGNVVTSFSWFGVNMLGVGLHSYGFMDKAFKWLLAFDVSQVLIIAIAFIPLRYWRSFRPGGPGSTSYSGPMPTSEMDAEKAPVTTR